MVKKILSPLVVGQHYIFYPHRSAMFTIDRANQRKLKRGICLHCGEGSADFPLLVCLLAHWFTKLWVDFLEIWEIGRL